MIPLVDTHCHLLAGLDDGPKSRDQAVEMCRILAQEGVQTVAALAHQDEAAWPAVTPGVIRQAFKLLKQDLAAAKIGLAAMPAAEVMVTPATADHWAAGKLLSLADRGSYVLIEMPHGQFVDIVPVVKALRLGGVRPVLAHAERQPEWVERPELLEALIEAGCVVQASSPGITRPLPRHEERALRDWFRRNLVHVFGSDGHSTRRRPPLMRAAYEKVVSWAGRAAADRVCSTNGASVLYGLPLKTPPIKPRGGRWFLPF